MAVYDIRAEYSFGPGKLVWEERQYLPPSYYGPSKPGKHPRRFTYQHLEKRHRIKNPRDLPPLARRVGTTMTEVVAAHPRGFAELLAAWEGLARVVTPEPLYEFLGKHGVDVSSAEPRVEDDVLLCWIVPFSLDNLEPPILRVRWDLTTMEYREEVIGQVVADWGPEKEAELIDRLRRDWHA